MSANFLMIIKSVIMGIVEGITEFLPISSTAHLKIVGFFINFVPGAVPKSLYTKAYVDMYGVVIQLGAILAIVVLYWDKIIKSLKNLAPDKWGFRLWFNIILAMIPSAVIGILVKKALEKQIMDNLLAISAAMIVGGILLLVIENKYRRRSGVSKIENVKGKQSLLIGTFQCLALWPGMSRSASTIMGAWLAGLDTSCAAEFSFFLAIPTMLGASLLEGRSFMKTIKATGEHFQNIQIIVLAVGFLVSFLVALVVVDKFIAFLKKRPMRVFSVYRILAGTILLVLVLSGIIV